MAGTAMNQYLLVGNRKAESWQVAQNKFIDVNGKQKQIRYCQGENSIFVDEQNPKSKVTHIWIEKGTLLVNKNDVVRNKFLQTHPDNPQKFFLYDIDAEAKEELQAIQLENNTRELFNDLDAEQKEAVATVLFGASTVTRWGKDKVEVELNKSLRHNPVKLASVINDPATELIYLTSTAVRLKIIEISPDKSSIRWGDSKYEIIPVPRGVNPLTEMSRFLRTNDGLVTLQDLGNKIKGKATKAKPPVKKQVKAKA